MLAGLWLFGTPLLFATLHRSAMHWSTPWNRQHLQWSDMLHGEGASTLAVEWMCGTVLVLSALVAAVVFSTMVDVSTSRTSHIRLSIARLASGGEGGGWDLPEPPALPPPPPPPVPDSANAG